MGQGNARVCCRAESRGHTGDNLEGDPGPPQSLGLLAASAEDERIASLETDDAFSPFCGIDQRFDDKRAALAMMWMQRFDAEVSGLRSEVEQSWRNQTIEDDQVGTTEPASATQRQQPRVAWTGADQDDSGTVVVALIVRHYLTLTVAILGVIVTIVSSGHKQSGKEWRLRRQGGICRQKRLCGE
jgi:hypothetical protein